MRKDLVNFSIVAVVAIFAIIIMGIPYSNANMNSVPSSAFQQSSLAGKATAFRQTGTIESSGIANAPLTGTCGGDVQCQCGDEVIENYTMQTNLVGCGEALKIFTDNVTLDCANFSIYADCAHYGAFGIFINTVTNVNVKNCDISCYTNGVRVTSSSKVNILDSQINYVSMGFHSIYSTDILLSNINMYHIDNGIVLQYTSNITINNSNMVEKRGSGIEQYYSNYTTIINNNISGNMFDGIGISLRSFSNNNVISHNRVFENYGAGISLDNSKYNLIEDNYVYNNTIRNMILYSNSENNSIRNNVLIGSGTGLHIGYSSNNLLHNNNISNVIDRGLWIEDSDNNLIVLNFIINNPVQVIEDEYSDNNRWDYQGIGNYWSDFMNNTGYPSYYEVNGDGNGIDNHPIWDFDDDGWFNYEDCDDNNSDVYPGRLEDCSTLYDDNCDGSTLDGCIFDYACYLYDDFSGDVLDDRWRELDSGMDEHYLDNVSENYHTAQLSPSDREIALELERYLFEPGDWAEFDLLYQSGDGNRICVVDIDESTRWFGLVGYWNEVEQGGNDFGLYHFNVSFTDYGADVYVTRPDNSTWFIQQYPQSPGLNHTFGFATRTGHNGVVHMDYDNVQICKRDNDLDGVFYIEDNCPEVHNPDQTDADKDGFGLACDCNDTNPEVNPGHPEWCGTPYDDNCDGNINEGCSPHGGSPIFKKIIQPATIREDNW
ncbi:MAG: NosD domain-containing protein [Nanoarchaeota archaeon]